MTIQNSDHLQLDGIAAPDVSPASSARVYFDVADKLLKVSLNGAPYAGFLTAGTVGWADDGAVVRLTTATDNVAIGSANATASRKMTVVETGADEGVRVEAEAAGNNVIDGHVVGEAAARIQLTTDQLRFGDGTAASDLSVSRVPTGNGPYLSIDNGLRVAGNVERINGALTISPVRTVPGGGDGLTLRGGNPQVVGPNSAVAGGAVTVQGADAVANGAAQATGGPALVVAGNAASGVGGAPAKGGTAFLRGGNGSANNGDGGDVRIEPGTPNGAGINGLVVCAMAGGQPATPSVVPRVDGEGAIGVVGRRWGSVRAVQVISGAYYEQEVFPEEFADLEEKLRVLQAELDANPDGAGVRHLARIVMLSARILLDSLRA